MATMIKVPALQFTQGGRTAYAMTPKIGDLLRIVPERANPDVIEDANRRLFIPHAQNFGNYVLDTEEWVSGGLMAAVAEGTIRYDERRHEATMDEAALDHARLFDGQHRRYGIDYALRRAHIEIENRTARLETSDDRKSLEAEIKAQQDYIEALLDQTIPVTVYVESDISKLQQMYADISKVRVPDSVTRTRFDRSDAFNVAALELAESHPFLANRVDMERSTLGRRSTKVVTLNQLASILRTLWSGIQGRTVDGVSARTIVERGAQFFDDMAAAAPEIKAVIEGRAEPGALRDRGNLALNVTILRIEAAIWRELHVVADAPRQQVIEFMAEIPKEPAESGLWVDAGVLPARLEKATPMGRSQEARKAVALAIEEFEERAIA